MCSLKKKVRNEIGNIFSGNVCMEKNQRQQFPDDILNCVEIEIRHFIWAEKCESRYRNVRNMHSTEWLFRLWLSFQLDWWCYESVRPLKTEKWNILYDGECRAYALISAIAPFNETKTEWEKERQKESVNRQPKAHAHMHVRCERPEVASEMTRCVAIECACIGFGVRLWSGGCVIVGVRRLLLRKCSAIQQLVGASERSMPLWDSNSS